MESAVSARSRHARRLFAGIALSYERVATVLSLGQDPRWRHALVGAIGARHDDRVLDDATGTGMVARALVRRDGCRVIGLDQSAQMLAAGSADGRSLVRAQGERLPFADESFDHLTFTYLLRYVDDPGGHDVRARPRTPPRWAGGHARIRRTRQPHLALPAASVYAHRSAARGSSAVDLMGPRSAISWARASSTSMRSIPSRSSNTIGGQPTWKLSPSGG